MTTVTPDTAIITGAASVAVAVVAGIVAFVSSRRQVKVDVQKTLNDGFGSLVNELQEERATLMEERAALRDKIEDLLVVVRDLEIKNAILSQEASRMNNMLAVRGLSPPKDD